MDIKVTGRKIRVTDALYDRVISKIGDALKVFDIQPMTADVVLRVANYKGTKERTICEVTVRVRGTVVRVTATKDDAEAAIDEAARMVGRQLRKYKTKVIDRRHRPHGEGLAPVEPGTELGEIVEKGEEEAEEDDDRLVRTKYIEYTRLTEEDALVQADLLGHDFYVFRDMQTGNVHVIYHRKDGGYGILKPEEENAEA